MQQSLAESIVASRLARVEILQTFFVRLSTASGDRHVPENLEVIKESTLWGGLRRSFGFGHERLVLNRLDDLVDGQDDNNSRACRPAIRIRDPGNATCAISQWHDG
jgi:hypothetical protein